MNYFRFLDLDDSLTRWKLLSNIKNDDSSFKTVRGKKKETCLGAASNTNTAVEEHLSSENI